MYSAKVAGKGLLLFTHCPRCLTIELRLSSADNASDEFPPTAPLRCRVCGTRFDKRMGLSQLHAQPAPGRFHWSVPKQPATAEPRVLAVLVVDDSISFSKLIRETLASRGLAVFDAKSPDEGLALFQAYQPQIGLAVIDLVMPKAGNLDLSAELDRLRPGLPVLYLVGAAKSVARCSIEARAPGSVLEVPFTEEQLIGRVGGLLNIEAAPRQRHGEELWERLIATSD